MRSDIRLAIGFHRHLKFRKLRKTLGPEGVLSLLILWLYAAENRPSGLLHGLDARDIAEAAEWKGPPRKFVRTLIDIGLLDETGDGILRIHDWEHHQPWIFHADARSEKARTSARARWGPAPIKENTDAFRMPDACEAHKVRNSPTPTPSPTPFPSPTPEDERPPRVAEGPLLSAPSPRLAENPLVSAQACPSKPSRPKSTRGLGRDLKASSRKKRGNGFPQGATA